MTPTSSPETMRAKFDAGKTVIVVSATLSRTADFSMMAAACGYDGMFVDLEHSAASLETTSLLCAAAVASGITPLVRVPSHDHQYMTRAMDTGAVGVIVPHVNSAEEARHVVSCCRFPPLGKRSVIGMTPVTRYRAMPMGELISWLNRETIVCVMIETPEAVGRAAEIAAVEGVDIVLVGPHDLSAEMGIYGQFRHPDFQAAMESVAAACRTHGKVLGIAGIKDEELLTAYLKLGVRFISAGNDSGFLRDAMQAQADRLRRMLGEEGAGGTAGSSY